MKKLAVLASLIPVGRSPLFAKPMYLFILGVVIAMTEALYANVVLVQQGKPQAVIVCGPSWIEQHGTEELSKYVRQITGALLVIVDGNSIEAELSKNVVVIQTLAGPTNDTYFIRSAREGHQNVLRLQGNRGRATLYAVYDFLETECGISFFEDGDRVPSYKNLRVPMMSRSETPYFAHRIAPSACAYTYSAETDWKAYLDYMTKKRLNTYNGGTEAEYARKLDMDLVRGVWTGRVSHQFVTAHPETKFIKVQWLDLPANWFVDPDDPMFRKKIIESIRPNLPDDNNTHFWDGAPYPECSPGETEEEKQRIKLAWARNFPAAVAEADPNGVLFMSGWFLVMPDWTPEVCKEFFQAMPNGRYFIGDVWAETWPVYRKTGYFGGQGEWAFGVMHTFGKVERLHGDLPKLIQDVQDIVNDPKARACTGFTIFPESIGHNFLYFDLCTRLAWDPRGIILSGFLNDYCRRRYGDTNMVRVWKLIIQTVYGDDSHPNPTPSYQEPLYSGGAKTRMDRPLCPICSAHKEMLEQTGFREDTKRRIGYLPKLRLAVRMLNKYAPQYGGNQFFARDYVDIMDTYLGIVFDEHAMRCHYAFRMQHQGEFEKQAALALQTLDQITELVATRPEFWIGDNPEVRKRLTALAGIKAYPTLLDYARCDRVELIREYYKPRVQAWINQMRENWGAKELPGLLFGPYLNITKSFIEGN